MKRVARSVLIVGLGVLLVLGLCFRLSRRSDETDLVAKAVLKTAEQTVPDRHAPESDSETTLEGRVVESAIERVALPAPQVVASRRSSPPGNRPIDFGGNYHVESERVRRMGRELDAARIQEWYAFLDTPHSQSMRLSQQEFNSLKNDVLDNLISQTTLPEGLGFLLVELYSDAKLGDVFRDFCIQRMMLYYEARWSSGPSDANDMESMAVRNAYWRAVQEQGTSIAGSALIGLERLSRTYPEFDRHRVRQSVVSLANSDATPLQTRITALQLCGIMGETTALATARRLAQEGGSIPLQLAAIATIGDLGSAGDAVFLESRLEATRDRLQKTAIETALAKLRSK